MPTKAAFLSIAMTAWIASVGAMSVPAGRAAQSQPMDSGASAKQPPYRVDVTVAPAGPTAPYTPFAIQIDFADLLRKLGATDRFAAGSVRVMRVESGGHEVPIPHAMSEDFAWSDRGEVSWVIEKSGQLAYHVYFDSAGRGPLPPARPIALVGRGDNFRYNRPGGEDPLGSMGMTPISADFDGDGKVDLVSRSLYSSTWGQPWFTIWFWRNIGTNEKPVYADFVRLYADGEAIPNNYSGCDLYDWDDDGKLDLITSQSVYRNTGKAGPGGAPVLTRLGDLPPVSVKGEPYCWLVGLRDHDGNGVADAFYLLYGVHYIYEGPPPRNFVKTALYRKMNTAARGQAPSLGTEEPIKLGGQIWVENYVISDFCDVDGDGDLDVVGSTSPLDRVPSRPQFCYWPNIASKGKPPVYGKARLIPNGWNLGSYGIWGVNNPAYRGVFASEGYRIRYHERAKTSLPDQMPRLQDRGLLKQIDGRCSVDGYSGVEVEDWEGDGDWDLIAGDEYGSLWLIENIGDNKRPVFASPKNLIADGKPMRVMRWQYIPDGNPEYYLGQTKPRYCDWDGDGDYDLIVANNTNRVILFENTGTRAAPKFAAGTILRVGTDETPFGWRCQPAVVDWNGDGLMDIVTTKSYGAVTNSGQGQVCVFLRYREGNRLLLKPGQPLHDEAGKPFGGAQWEVCDWDGDGRWDLIGLVGEWGKSGPGLYRNVGTNAEPRFKSPVRLKAWGKEIGLSAHETTFAAVDWYGTGKPDLVCGGESGLFYFFRRPAIDAEAPPAACVSEPVRKKR
jgi:hypothetical protein